MTDIPRQRILDALHTITTVWDDMLPTGPAAVSTGTIGRHATGSRPPVPAHVLDVRALTLSVLSSWSLAVIDDLDLHPTLDGQNAHQLAQWLTTHVGHLAAHEASSDVVDELEDAARKCLGVAQPRAEQRFAGVCDVCAGDLYGDHHKVRCKQCAQVVDGATQQERVRDAVRDRLLTAQEIVDLSPNLGHRLRPDQVSRMVSRGLLVAKGQNQQGRALYSAEDVCDRIAERFGTKEGAA